MSNIAEQLKLARGHQRAGRLRKAALMAREILRGDPKQVDAFHLLAMTTHGLGELDFALKCARYAVNARPRNATFHRTLGTILSSQGKHHEAIVCYQKCIQLRPGDATAYYNLGNALIQQGRRAEAIMSYQMALRLNPNNPQPYYNLGKALESAGKLPEAEECYRRAVQLKPDYVQSRVELANIFEAQGKLEEAVPLYVQALRYDPRNWRAQNNLGIVLNRLGRHEAAVTSFRQALRIDSTNAQVWNNLGDALLRLDRRESAEKSLRKAIELRPDHAKAFYNLGTLHLEYGELEAALEAFENALRLHPDYPEAHVHRAHVWLMNGEFERGWPAYEWRWRLKPANQSRFEQPKWDGSPLEGKTILLHTEQGFGDTFQFVRFARAVKERGGTVIMSCQPRLFEVLSGCPGIDRFVSEEQPLPTVDVQASVVSLPAILATTAGTIPAEVPYLFVAAERADVWREKLSGAAGLKIGIAWQGSPTYARDRTRSIPLEEFAPLAEVSGARWISLQKGPGEDQIAKVSDRFSVEHLGPDLDETNGAFVDTAAVIQNLDLVITSDTSIAHLAGALGAPVWVALSHMPEWQWQLQRNDSPWYPTMRLFRQSQRGDWAGVFRDIKSALIERIATHNGDEGSCSPE